MNTFEPFRMNLSPWRTPRLFWAAASVPAPGSVSAKQPIFSPDAIAGMYFFF